MTAPRPITGRRLIRRSDVVGILRAARDRKDRHAIRDHALLAVLVNTGIQSGEALGLRFPDLELGPRPTLTVTRRPRGRHPDRRRERIPISPQLAALLRTHLARYSIQGDQRVFGIGPKRLFEIFREVCQSAGVKGRPNLHTLRHAAAVRLLEASDGSVEFVAMMTGRADLWSAYRYLPVGVTLARRYLARVRPIL